MSKVNAMQAIREARYAARTAKTQPASTPAANRDLVGGGAGAGDELSRPIGLVPSAPSGDDRVPPDGTAPSGIVHARATGAASGRAGHPDGAGLVGTDGAVGIAPLRGLPGSRADAADDDSEALCGHRSMTNRNCRRPAGHAEKNHRYN